jgi:hypothetical protein
MPALRTELLSSGKTTTGFEIPEEFVDRLGGGRRPKVRVRLQGIEFGTSIAPMGGRFMLGVSAERRAASGVVAGQTYDIEIDLDTDPRKVDVPEDFAAALAAEPAAEEFFASLSYSNQSWHVLQITGAKQAETRTRRIATSVAKLAQGKPR